MCVCPAHLSVGVASPCPKPRSAHWARRFDGLLRPNPNHSRYIVTLSPTRPVLERCSPFLRLSAIELVYACKNPSTPHAHPQSDSAGVQGGCLLLTELPSVRSGLHRSLRILCCRSIAGCGPLFPSWIPTANCCAGPHRRQVRRAPLGQVSANAGLLSYITQRLPLVHRKYPLIFGPWREVRIYPCLLPERLISSLAAVRCGGHGVKEGSPCDYGHSCPFPAPGISQEMSPVDQSSARRCQRRPHTDLPLTFRQCVRTPFKRRVHLRIRYVHC